MAGEDQEWARLSREATSAWWVGDGVKAVELLDSSVVAAERAPGMDRLTVLNLLCKKSMMLYTYGHFKEAIEICQVCLKGLSEGDWRHQLLASRFLEVERSCLLREGKLEKALQATEKMNRIDETLLGKHAMETDRRRIRQVEADFAQRDFALAIKHGEVLLARLDEWDGDDPDRFLLLVYLGAARLAVGDTVKGKRDLERANALSENVNGGTPFIPLWVTDVIKTLPTNAETLKFLGRKSWG